jgi:hypothetical protein
MKDNNGICKFVTTISITTAYKTAPVCVVNAEGDGAGDYRIADVTATRFTIKTKTPDSPATPGGGFSYKEGPNIGRRAILAVRMAQHDR